MRVSEGRDKDQEGGHAGEPRRADADEGTARNLGQDADPPGPGGPQVSLPQASLVSLRSPLDPPFSKQSPPPPYPARSIHTSVPSLSSWDIGNAGILLLGDEVAGLELRIENFEFSLVRKFIYLVTKSGSS